MVRAGIDCVDRGALGRKRSSDHLLYRFKFTPAIMTPPDARLIGYHDHRDMPFVGRSDYFRSSRNNNDVINPVQIAGIFNDDAVAVQKQSRAPRRRAPQNLAPDTL